MRIILASASPRRKSLISLIEGVSAEIIPAADEEKAEFINPGWHACALAKNKAREVWAKSGGVVVGADTIVVLDGKMLGKPKSDEEAREMLSSLSDRTHSVITGVCVVSERKEVCKYAETQVSVGALTQEFIASYVGTGSPLDKAGAYGIQDGEFACHVKRIDGDLNNVIGLPVAMLEQILKEFSDGKNQSCT